MSLDGIVVADTELSMVDGQRGRLVVRGRELDDLAGHLTFEEMGQLLLSVPLSDLGEARVRVYSSVRESVLGAPHLLPIEVLRVSLDRLESPSNLDLIAALGVAVACLGRVQAGLEPREPDATLSHSADILQMRFGASPAAAVKGLETYLVTVAEHGMNASTFTARVVASTRAGARAAVSAALGALQGPLHGGAPGPVLDMLDELEKNPDRAGWLRAQIAAGERLMGFGHRIYKVRDPRADVLSLAALKLLGTDPRGRFALAFEIEELARKALAELKPGRSLDTNVEYYTALLLDGLGFARQDFTAIFACGRVLGWLAHVAEQERTGRLIRPESRYVGAIPEPRAGGETPARASADLQPSVP